MARFDTYDPPKNGSERGHQTSLSVRFVTLAFKALTKDSYRSVLGVSDRIFTLIQLIRHECYDIYGYWYCHAANFWNCLKGKRIQNAIAVLLNVIPSGLGVAVPWCGEIGDGRA